MSAIVADTSEWIEYFAGRPAPFLEHGLAAGLVVIPPVVVAELMSGARNATDQAALQDLLGDLRHADVPFAHWVRVGTLRAALLARGLTISTPDAHVAQCALDLDAVLLTRDSIFTEIASLTALRLSGTSER